MGTSDATLFDRWSAVYDRPRFQEATYRPVHDAVLARLADRNADRNPDGNLAGRNLAGRNSAGRSPDQNPGPMTVLDLGCGTGQLTNRLADRFPRAHIIGVDYSAGMLGEARVRVPDGANVSLIQADAQCLPLEPVSVDVVVCTESFHWYPDQQGVLRDLATILRPGGQLIIASIATITSFGEVAIGRLSSLGGQPIHALPPSRLAELLRTAGFDVVHQRRVPRMGFVPWPVLTDAVLRTRS